MNHTYSNTSLTGDGDVSAWVRSLRVSAGSIEATSMGKDRKVGGAPLQR